MATALDDDFDSAVAAAKAGIKAFVGILDHREFYTVALPRENAAPLLFGLYSSEKEAAKGLAAHGLATDIARIIKINPDGDMQARISGDPLPDDCKCGHPQYLHHYDGSSRGRCALTVTKKCSCVKFAKHKWPLPAVG